MWGVTEEEDVMPGGAKKALTAREDRNPGEREGGRV